MAAAVATLRLSAPGHRNFHPMIGLCGEIGWKPMRFRPKSHAVGDFNSSSPSSRLTSPSSVVARTIPDSRNCLNQLSGVRNGENGYVENTARRGTQAFSSCKGSTLWPAKMIAAAPIASDSRIKVPALPGSERSTAMTTSAGLPEIRRPTRSMVCGRPQPGRGRHRFRQRLRGPIRDSMNG